MINQQYPYMEDVSGTNGGMQDTRSQDALHQALLLRTSQMNPNTQPMSQGGGMGGINPMLLARMLKSNPASQSSNSTGAPVYDYSQPYNPATGQDWATTGSGYAGNGGYDPTAMGGMNDYLSQMGLDTGGFTGSGDFSMGGIGDSLAGAGDWTSGLGDMFSGIGDWFAGIDWAGMGAGAGEAAAEVAPAAAAA